MVAASTSWSSLVPEGVDGEDGPFSWMCNDCDELGRAAIAILCLENFVVQNATTNQRFRKIGATRPSLTAFQTRGVGQYFRS